MLMQQSLSELVWKICSSMLIFKEVTTAGAVLVACTQHVAS
jgi:hypothetical protein